MRRRSWCCTAGAPASRPSPASRPASGGRTAPSPSICPVRRQRSAAGPLGRPRSTPTHRPRLPEAARDRPRQLHRALPRRTGRDRAGGDASGAGRQAGAGRQRRHPPEARRPATTLASTATRRAGGCSRCRCWPGRSGRRSGASSRRGRLGRLPPGRLDARHAGAGGQRGLAAPAAEDPGADAADLGRAGRRDAPLGRPAHGAPDPGRRPGRLPGRRPLRLRRRLGPLRAGRSDTFFRGQDEGAEAEAARRGDLREPLGRARSVGHLGDPGDGRDGPAPLRAAADLHHQGRPLDHRPGASAGGQLQGPAGAPEPLSAGLTCGRSRSATACSWRSRGRSARSGPASRWWTWSSRSCTARSGRTARSRGCSSWRRCRTSAPAWSARRSGMDKIVMKAAFQAQGLPVVNYLWFTRKRWQSAADDGRRRDRADAALPALREAGQPRLEHRDQPGRTTARRCSTPSRSRPTTIAGCWSRRRSRAGSRSTARSSATTSRKPRSASSRSPGPRSSPTRTSTCVAGRQGEGRAERRRGDGLADAAHPGPDLATS